MKVVSRQNKPLINLALPSQSGSSVSGRQGGKGKKEEEGEGEREGVGAGRMAPTGRRLLSWASLESQQAVPLLPMNLLFPCLGRRKGCRFLSN